MSKQYFIDKYEKIFKELFDKKTDWELIKNKEDLSGELDFCYTIKNHEIKSKLKLLPKEDFIKYDEIEINKSDINYDKIVNVNILLISEKDIYIYKEGKVETDKIRYYSQQNYFNYTFQQISADVFKVLNPVLKENKLDTNGFKIISMKYGIDKDFKVNLLEIDIDPDLSIEIDKSQKIKLHYWIFFDLLNKFVFKNNLNHRWTKCDLNFKIPDYVIDKRKKYLINRSNILKQTLNKNGWIEGDINEVVEFSYWDVQDAKGLRVNSKISVFPRNITNRIDNKKTMYLELQKNNLTHFLPVTYTELESIDSSIFTNNKLFFLKKHNGSGGKDVVAINNFDIFKQLVNNNYRDYILQEEVNNMYLENNHKTCLRIHVLLTEKLEIYIHKEGKVFIHPNVYDKKNLDKETHNSTYTCEYKKFSTMHYYKETFDKIKDITFLCVTPFIKNVKLTNSYHILGLDYILDNDFNPFLIEVNTYPNISSGLGHIDREVKTVMINDFYELYIKKTKKHNWILCN
jgi:hypothetical protein